MSRPLRALGAAALLAIAGCWTPPSSEPMMRDAHEAYAAGRFESALRHSERAMQQHPEHPLADELAFHVKTLRALDRDVEADAFEGFVERSLAGEDTDSADTQPTRDECLRLERERFRTTRNLIRRPGEWPQHRPFLIGTVAATFGIGADGEVVDLHVVRARHPAAAWLLIRSIADADVSQVRLDSFDASEFPLEHCVFLESYSY